MAFTIVTDIPIVRWLNAYLPVVVWAGVIFLLSAQPVLPSASFSVVDFLMKKGAHMFVYALLYLLLVRAAVITQTRQQQRQYWAAPLVLCFLYAVSDEVHQAFTGGSRMPSFRDVIFDVIGASVALLKQYRYI